MQATARVRKKPKRPKAKRKPTPILPLCRLGPMCQEQGAIVRGEWPDGIPLTRKSALRAAELELHLGTACDRLFGWSGWSRWSRAPITKAFDAYWNDAMDPVRRRKLALAMLNQLLKESKK